VFCDVADPAAHERFDLASVRLSSKGQNSPHQVAIRGAMIVEARRE
jgi:hypothetical protein